ncbi:MAG: type I glutamate--ammonia ligase [candidate division Zixibacteria bacterium RBG_16_53_22]|nr:MAG: type I glutamate--ammonia ligase [candidate division Zixibacteria bacterium RBG_16_53_22]
MIDALLKKIRDGKFEFVDLKFTDIRGAWRHITIPADKFTDKIFKDGIGIDGSSIGFLSVKAGDMIVIPDPSFHFIDPFWEMPTISVLGNIYEVNPTEPHARDPRFTAAKAIKRLKKLLPQAEAFMGPEFEFYLFDSVRYEQTHNHGFYYLGAEEAEWNSGLDDEVPQGHYIRYKEGYHAAPPHDRTYEIRSYMCKLFQETGLNVKYHHHEVGGASQQEIETSFGPMFEMADKSQLAKYLIKNSARRFGKSASFMPKPLFMEPGSGLHVHQYLAKDGFSLFYDKSKPLNLSDMGRYYLGGLLKHSPALLAFTNPSTNSYKRLVPGFEAPVRISYSIGNRTAAVRIPGYIKDPSEMRLEFRPPDGTANIYFAFAAMLMAGLDGIENTVDPGEPFTGDVSSKSDSLAMQNPFLPSSLSRALEALETDVGFLRVDDVFAPQLIDTWLKLKQNEVEQIRLRPHPWEFRLYYDA